MGPEPEAEFDDAGNHGVEEGVEHREPEDRVVEQPEVVVQPDEAAGPADLDVGQAEPYPEEQGIGQKHQQDDRCRQHEEKAEEVPVVAQAFKQAHLPDRSGFT